MCAAKLNRNFSRVAVQLGGVCSLVSLMLGGCGENVRTEPAYCPYGGTAPALGGSTAQGGTEAGSSSTTGGSSEAGAAGTSNGGTTHAHGGTPNGGVPSEEGGSGGVVAGDAGMSSSLGGSAPRGGSNAGGRANGGTTATAGTTSSAGATAAGGRSGSAGSSGGGGKAGTGGGTAKCGDKVVAGSEQCDDGNKAQGDGCYLCKDSTACDKCWHDADANGNDGNSLCHRNVVNDAIAKWCFDPNEPWIDGSTKALNGPATGQDRSTLCQAVLECVLTHDCLDLNQVSDSMVLACYCGSKNLVDCSANGAKGPCASQIAAATEPQVVTGVEAIVAANMNDPTLPAGAAAALLDCQAAECRSQCFPGAPPAASGGTAGTTGTAGSTSTSGASGSAGRAN